MRAGSHVYTLCEVVDVMKTGRESFDQDIQDPVMSGRELFDLRVQHGNTGAVMAGKLNRLETRRLTLTVF
jgi:hypothetical protein